MRRLLLLAVSCFTLSNAFAQSEYKRWMESEKRGSTYSTKEIKKAAKEYTELIYEERGLYGQEPEEEGKLPP